MYQSSINMAESLEGDLHCSDSSASDSEAECVTETDREEELARPPHPKQPRKDSGAAKYRTKFMCILSIYIIFSAR